jgi:hypothetical protein
MGVLEPNLANLSSYGWMVTTCTKSYYFGQMIDTLDYITKFIEKFKKPLTGWLLQNDIFHRLTKISSFP